MNYSDLSHDEIIKTINNTALFAGVGIHEQNLLANKFSIRHVNGGEIVIEQGDVGDSLYIIVKGTVLVSIKSPSEGWVRINKLGPGDVVGEIAIVKSIRRTARITTEVPCTFLTITAHDFLDIYQYFPPGCRDNIQLIIAKRLASHKHLS